METSASTNATSGVAIKQRQIGTSKNLAFGFDAFNQVKEREGKVLIDLMQGSGLENILVNIVMDDDEKEELIGLSKHFVKEHGEA